MTDRNGNPPDEQEEILGELQEQQKEQQQPPKWFTPTRLLIIFCIINMLNYLDRGVIASNGVNGSPRSCKDGKCNKGSGIQGDFKLSNFEDGVLSSAFMVGLFVASIIFAEISKRFNPFRLIGVGLSVWTLATAGCGLSFGFWSIAVCRMLVGVGEASFVSLAAPFIDDNAPKEKRSSWLSYFYACIPVGVAAGYIFGGVIGSALHWRAAFFIEAALMLPFAIFAFVATPINLAGPEKETDLESQEKVDPPQTKFLTDMLVLFKTKVYIINAFGYVAFTFVLGAYSYWGPKAGKAIYHMKSADMLFGAVTVVCGIAGTAIGGLVLDYIGSTVANGFKILTISVFVGGAACLGAFASKSLFVFIFLFAVGELFLFATQGPVNQINLHVVPPQLRALAMATSTVLIHILGDVPSSPIVGAVQDRIQNWRTTTLILTSIYFVAAALWGYGFFYTRRRTEEEVSYTSHQEPLLDHD